MKTLIELYDSEPILNVLAACVFKPEEVIFLGSAVVNEPSEQEKITDLFRFRQLDTKTTFYPVDTTDCSAIDCALSEIVRAHEDCVIEVTGGTDLTLLESGIFGAMHRVPLIYYDTDISKYIPVIGDPFGGTLDVAPAFTCREFLALAGATVDEVRNTSIAEDEATSKQVSFICRLSVEYPSEWNYFVGRLQGKLGRDVGDRFREVAVRDFKNDGPIVDKLAGAGIIEITSSYNGYVDFRFTNKSIGIKIHDIEGYWLEIMLYKLAEEMHFFDDIRSGIKFRWALPGFAPNFNVKSSKVSGNEVDLMMTKGIRPIFISCKNKRPVTDDLNEIYMLKKKFGGDFAVAVLACTEESTDEAFADRAYELGIDIIHRGEILDGKFAARMKQIVI